jgi:hypothetical protein
VKVAKDMRQVYAAELRALADQVEKGEYQPNACYAFIFYNQGIVTRWGREDVGSIPFFISGVIGHCAREIGRFPNEPTQG